MQINRLFEIVYLLMERKNVTAKELAERFEVSTRTVYRDIDTLSMAGIPVYASRGAGGGIHLLGDFVLDKSLLSDGEQNDILSSLQGLSAIQVPDVEPVLNKLAALFGKNQSSWIQVDFSRWSGGIQEREKFALLKNTILHRTVVSFDYFSTSGEKTSRIVEPLKLLFRGQGWYLFGFCRGRHDFRIFKISRMKNLLSVDQTFNRAIPANAFDKTELSNPLDMILLMMKIEASMAYRVYDEFEEEDIIKHEDGSFTVTAAFPDTDWIYGYILSLGSGAEVLEPADIRETIKNSIKDMQKKYE